MLYDGACPLCMREVNFLRSRDQGVGKIHFVDIAADSYDPADHQGISFEQAMKRIHAIEADGKVITDVAVFRRLYQAVGLGWLYAVTEVPAVGRMADALYSVWARYRMEVTGRAPMAVVLEQQRLRQAGGSGTCADSNGACEMVPQQQSAADKEKGVA